MTTLVIAFDNSTNFLMILQTNVTKRQIEIIRRFFSVPFTRINLMVTFRVVVLVLQLRVLR